MDTKLTPTKRKFILVGQKRLDFYLVPPTTQHYTTPQYYFDKEEILSTCTPPPSGSYFFQVFLSDHPEIIRTHTSCGPAKVNNRRARACSIPLHGPAHTIHCVHTHRVLYCRSTGFYSLKNFCRNVKYFFKYSAL